jgi:hypothetical protein
MFGILLVAAAVIGTAIIFSLHDLGPAPYREEVRKLHPGMSRLDVVTALGYPKEGDMNGIEGTAYEIAGEPLPLIIRYDRSARDCNECGYAEKWCGFFPVDQSPPANAKERDFKLECHDIK